MASGNVISPVTKTVNIIHTSDFFMSTFLERLRKKKIEVDSCLFGEYAGDGELIASTSHSLEQVMRSALKKVIIFLLKLCFIIWDISVLK